MTDEQADQLMAELDRLDIPKVKPIPNSLILCHFTHSELDAIKSSAFLNGFCCAGAVFLWLTLLGLLLWSLFP